MNFIAKNQLDVMLFICGMCGILAVMTVLAKSLPYRTRHILTSMEISAAMLLFCDRLCYLYRGDTSALGFYMVRVCNGAVYLISLLIPYLVTRFLNDLLINDAKLSKTPKQLVAAEAVFAIGIILVIISFFTGLYYTFDSNNNYQRSPLNALCYLAPLLIVILQEWTIIKYFKRIKRSLAVSMLICIALPMVSSALQMFLYGISIINITTALIVCVFYTYTLNYLSEVEKRAKIRELNLSKEAREKEAAIFKQTVEALASAIDAKDKYTRGHSARVAKYALMISERAGLSQTECEQVYFAGLLHDIGKIGISSSILNKKSRLTEEEYEQIKAHSEKGGQILSGIRHAPFLSIGARFHHERFDGKGYPDGLAGYDIPKIARILAVADAYDAMTSARCYRDALEKEKVYSEFVNGSGTQFDPDFVKIILEFINENP